MLYSSYDEKFEKVISSQVSDMILQNNAISNLELANISLKKEKDHLQPSCSLDISQKSVTPVDAYASTWVDTVPAYPNQHLHMAKLEGLEHFQCVFDDHTELLEGNLDPVQP